MKSGKFRKKILLLMPVVLIGLWLRLAQAQHSPLWYDEVFSIVVATGHRLSTVQDVPDPALADYVEPNEFVPVAYFKRFAEFDFKRPSLNVSNTNAGYWTPPLHETLLACWLRLFGTSDLALRSFSLLWGIATIPLLWLIARRIGGVEAGLLAVTFFLVHPTAVHYAVEGRCYSMLIFFSAAMLWLTIRCHDKGTNVARFIAMTVVAVCGLLTHFYFAFFQLSCWIWLFLFNGHTPRKMVVLQALVSLAIISHWYFMISHMTGVYGPGTFWFISDHFPVVCELAAPLAVLFWQFGDEGISKAMVAALPALAAVWASVFMNLSLLRGRLTRIPSLVGGLGVGLTLYAFGLVNQEPFSLTMASLAMGIYAIASVCLKRVCLSTRRAQLVGLLVVSSAFSLIGPLASYFSGGEQLIICHRYYLTILVPSLCLLALGLLRLPRPWKTLTAAILLPAWIIASANELLWETRQAENLVGVANFIRQQDPHLPILMDEWPGVAVAIARKLPSDRLMTCWSRDRQFMHSGKDLSRLVNGYPGVIVVLGRQPKSPLDMEPLPINHWFMHNARLQNSYSGTCYVRVFVPLRGQRFSSN
jgi:uncharacterized membrane protein